MDTEIKLIHWRGGQTAAERLCANILSVEGYAAVDPQCPLGGPDGLKDVLCEKNGWSYVGAAYFPPTEQEFKDVRQKFSDDLQGVHRNDAQGIVFLTNQRLTPAQRKELEQIAAGNESRAIIYHRERLRVILDSPIGFALRLEHFGIEMSAEEQVSFFSNWQDVFSSLLQEQTKLIIEALSRKLDAQFIKHSLRVDELVSEVVAATQSTISVSVDERAKSTRRKIDTSPFSSSSDWTVGTLLLLHQAITFDWLPNEFAGTYRANLVWVGPPDSTPETARFVPPSPDQVPQLVEELFEWWRKKFPEVQSKTAQEKLLAVTEFHARLLYIHPFLDGNGRLARFALAIQTQELLGVFRPIDITERLSYFSALDAAHEGNLEPLRLILSQAIFGVEEI